MTTTAGLDDAAVEYRGIKKGEWLRNIDFGWIGQVVQFDFDAGDVFCVIENAEGKRHGALLSTYEFYTPAKTQ